MGRIFEVRKHKMFARYAKMSKQFSRVSKEVFMAVKAAGPNPDNNSRLRAAIQNAKSFNMPKDRLDAAIKKASSKDEKDLEIMTYEGYGPYGIAVLVETATDNPTRTVANIRMYFNKYGGSLGTSGAVEYLFEHKCNFRIRKTATIDPESLELDLIDAGCEELSVDGDEIIIYGPFDSFGSMQQYFEAHEIEIIASGFDRIPTATKKLTPEQEEEVNKMLDKIEEDEDVQNVYSTIE
ncbi:MAG: YebC/PmpR family DNA-binding transcriptional regulator [Saprospiraceae bacterium]|nr:YebC/PmpR family DNA-binding transcriptional regulator [Saprospiraceae bacterium]MBK8485361.1 YebC/PmpR family DNA-binding transcriptional regulator [Saprospiraceae bacterium]MBK9222578.1 YebC/PmpR family DNA-binding transcriptional regulator [Saprospiraceae bacterium]MBK9720389.1 YebC/PmpR family DNA-binding transcriptional regulator [Saprospiraceae bacterium]MBK9727359.1 YebC/PmpR family DNA-binding transcriptional regulator [Saprospiraceae bacterium]